jgi:hypothetical protein
MRKEFIFLIALSLLFVACSLPRNTSVMVTPTPTSFPKEASYHVDIRADTRTLKVGETVTITGTIVGGLGNPLYSMKLKDQGASQSALLVSLTPSNEITRKADASNVLKFVSTNVVSNQVTTVLQGHSPGVTEVSISVNGEIGETDGSGRWWFNYVTKFSEGLAITVTNQ